MKIFTHPKRYDVNTLEDDDLICYCIEVSKGEIINAIKDGAATLNEIKNLQKLAPAVNAKRKIQIKDATQKRLMR